ncbi:delta-1-pyrroline-5-carboxylate synthase-like isoform X1 [Cucumis melo var. makuwa]|uniref:Delta-1-pyrroline-5-carboxylate synthase-like isoform X1 n=1 Tax=Cucumis melo var. makuwa TaxID=1194695 RepID=A0A5A7UNB6_CUCMM|nr:delta-1-pyrroline-5-carboxylate synthase-like isoform X1 [Cucumis melo var. makuwa]TYK24414.1 delta-1-pyrroline-5-carboxylate synthase-like isoform X1 [Cucumis melo var. makuwa]
MKGTLFHKDAHLLTLALKSKDRRKILMDVTDVLEDNENIILAENSAVIKAPEKLASDLGLESVSCSFGVLLIVFKSRPDALVQVMMDIKSFSSIFLLVRSTTIFQFLAILVRD